MVSKVVSKTLKDELNVLNGKQKIMHEYIISLGGQQKKLTEAINTLSIALGEYNEILKREQL